MRKDRPPIEINYDLNEVSSNGKKIKIKGFELDFVRCLADAYPGHVSRDQIGRYIYGGNPDIEPDSEILNSRLYYVRQKLAKIGVGIKTVYKVGYSLVSNQ